VAEEEAGAEAAEEGEGWPGARAVCEPALNYFRREKRVSTT
jgi:hypothetical protein